MRISCESCGAAQPADWTAGDRCTSCGEVVRRDTRCHWCARWTPAARFCRHCGAELVAVAHYGAARMLKAAGVDQLALPERLAALDRDHCEHLTRLYQRQAAVVARAVDDAIFAESFLRRSGWYRALEDELVAALPVDDDTLGWWQPAEPPLGNLDRLRALCASSPFDLVRMLAGLALLRAAGPQMTDWARDPAVDSSARAALYSNDMDLRVEAALALSHWRLCYARRRADDDDVVAALREPPLESPLEGPAAIALALRGAGAIEPAALGAPDRDDAFAAALVLGDADRLRAALADADRRFAAAVALASQGHGSSVAPALAALEPGELSDVLHYLDRADQPVPELRAALYEIAGRGDAHLRYRAAKVIAKEQNSADAMRLLQLEPTDSDVIQLILQTMALPAVELTAVAAELIVHGRFASHQYGVDDLADSGRLGDDFVPEHWNRAIDDERRRGLLRFAERQLSARGDAALHRFVLSVVFGPYEAHICDEAWWTLKRWYRSVEYSWEGPLNLDVDAIEAWFGPVPAFLGVLRAYLLDPDAHGELALHERVASMLRYTEAASVAAVAAAASDAFDELFQSIPALLANGAARTELRSAAVRFCELVSEMPLWRDRVLAVLDAAAGGDAAFDARETARRIRERANS